jgi:hypothetical protein
MRVGEITQCVCLKGSNYTFSSMDKRLGMAAAVAVVLDIHDGSLTAG